MHNERGKENADFDAPLLVSKERDQRMKQEVHKKIVLLSKITTPP